MHILPSIHEELLCLRAQIDIQMNVLENEANRRGQRNVAEMQNSDGSWPLVDLLVAKSNVLLALTIKDIY